MTSGRLQDDFVILSEPKILRLVHCATGLSIFKMINSRFTTKVTFISSSRTIVSNHSIDYTDSLQLVQDIAHLRLDCQSKDARETRAQEHLYFGKNC